MLVVIDQHPAGKVNGRYIEQFAFYKYITGQYLCAQHPYPEVELAGKTRFQYGNLRKLILWKNIFHFFQFIYFGIVQFTLCKRNFFIPQFMKKEKVNKPENDQWQHHNKQESVCNKRPPFYALHAGFFFGPGKFRFRVNFLPDSPVNFYSGSVCIPRFILKEFPDVLMRIGSNSTYALSTGYTSTFPTKLPYRSIGAFYLPKNTKNADLAVFVASGPWKTLGKYGPKTKRAEGLSFHPTIEIVNGPADSKGVKTQVAQIKIVAPESLAKSKGVYRLAAFDQKGKKMKSAGALTRSGEQSPSEFMFEPEGKSIGRLELEYRPYEPLKFSSVALQPKS